MLNAAVVTDASADLSPDAARDLGITVAPLGYELGGKRFLSGEQTPGELYKALDAGAAVTIEGVAADDFEQGFREAGSRASTIICACQSVGSSFTRVSAEVAARRVSEDGLTVRLLSPGRATSALAAICIVGAKAAAAGASADDVFARMEGASTAADAYFLARDLAQLERSGQLATVTSQSNVGPLNAGIALFRLRGRLSALSVHPDYESAEAALIETIEARTNGRPVVLVATHADSVTDAGRLLRAAQASLRIASVHTTNAGPVVASLLGRGCYGLGFCVSA
jgi:DegV family protein with EDD domain